jgi:hypothetical protein
MADRLYLSLWYPNFRLESLPAALTGVLRQFSAVGAKRVSAASAYPINFTEPPTYQRIYVNTGLDHAPPGSQPIPDTENPDSIIETAVAEATEQLHDDTAYEFEMRWQLWAPEAATGEYVSRALAPGEEDDLGLDEEEDEPRAKRSNPAAPDNPWKLRPHTVRILGFGPSFDMAGFEQNGHLLVDFGLDTPWVMDSPASDDPAAPGDTAKPQPLDFAAQLHIQQNVEKLLAFTLLVEKNCGISSRLLWTESGEPLAEKLIARLQRVN